MKVKKLLNRDENSRFVSNVFDSALKKYTYSNKIDNLELREGAEDLRIGDNKTTIFVNLNDPLILSKDEKAAAIIILSGLHRIMIRRIFGTVPRYIEDLLVYRDMIKKGLGEGLFYYFYVTLMEHHTHVIENLEDFMSTSLFWLAFSEHDDYNTDTLKELIKKFKCKKDFEKETKTLFRALSKDLWNDKNLEKAVKLYEKLS